MTRRHLAFTCEGSELAATLDLPPPDSAPTSGLLIVTGGNELRAGAWNGQALLAARIAAQGHAVFRFDRRGVGDSEGANGEFRSSGPDIAAALAAFRAACPGLVRIVGMGNCDAASALMLARGAGCDSLLLANPWTFEEVAESAELPPQILRQHYIRRLTDPAAIRRLLTGGVSIRKLLSSLLGAVQAAPPPSGLTGEMAAGIADFPGPIVFAVAERDRTGQAFQASWPKGDSRVKVCPGASHSFVEADAREWLAAEVLALLSIE